MAEPPPPGVAAAFGAAGEPFPLAGGQGSAWRVGGLVLKPADLPADELAWQAIVLGAVQQAGFRLAPPRRARDGSLVVEGWTAWKHVEGRHEAGRWSEIVAVGERLSAALAGLPRPAFLDRRGHPWSVADRVAWGELPPDHVPGVRHLDRLVAARRPVHAASQVVHGDLTGNVLFAEGLPPAVIDLSPYWRPPGFASAVVVADALVWEGAGPQLLDEVPHVPELAQHLVRALIFRTVTGRLFRPDEPDRPDAADPYLPAVELACRLAAS